MDKHPLQPWFRAASLGFLAGAILVGPLDFFHTWTGVQTYLVQNRFSVTSVNWPWYLPIQMGLIGIAVAVGWPLIRLYCLEPLIGIEKRSAVPGKVLMPIAACLVAFCYFLAFLFLDAAHYTSYFVLLYLFFLIIVALFGSRHQIMAFLIISLIGPFAEWVLLVPAIGYYAFKNPDWFGRASTWLLPTYGWVGIFIHELTWEIRKPGKV